MRCTQIQRQRIKPGSPPSKSMQKEQKGDTDGDNDEVSVRWRVLTEDINQ